MKTLILILTLWGSTGLFNESSESKAQEPWRCESLAQTLHEDLGRMSVGSITQITNKAFWFINWDGYNYTIKGVATQVDRSMWRQGALFLEHTYKDGYDNEGNYAAVANYNIQGTICTVLISSNELISISYINHNN